MDAELAGQVRAIVREELAALLGAAGRRVVRVPRPEVAEARRVLGEALARLGAGGVRGAGGVVEAGVDVTPRRLCEVARVEVTRGMVTVAGRVLAEAGWQRGERRGRATGKGGAAGGGRERVWRRG